jgi:hypothetical protein
MRFIQPIKWINEQLKNKMCRDVLLRLHNVTATPGLRFVSETWIKSKRGKIKSNRGPTYAISYVTAEGNITGQNTK